MEDFKIGCECSYNDYLRISDADNDNFAVITIKEDDTFSDVLINKTDAILIIQHLKNRFDL